MTQRPLALGILAALVLVLLAGRAPAEGSPRETPLVKAIKRAQASVVNIHSEKTAQDGDALFGSAGRGRKVNGMGTGIVVDERGYVLTNHHVVLGVDTLRVVLVDGSTYHAHVVSFDAQQDLAVIKVQPSRPLPVMPLGTSSDLMLGETVIAVGNAFGYEHTVTSGIVSALGRDVEVNEKQSYRNLIQTDASINPGNSGGPLINLEGDVVGVNVAIRAGAQRIGFAIPIDDARRTVARLLSVEQIGGTWHGVVAADRRQGRQSEVVVDRAKPNSPAEKAGLHAGDVIVKVGEIEVRDSVDLERGCLGVAAGATVPLVVRREGRDETVELVLGARTAPGSDRVAAGVSQTTVVRANNSAEDAANDKAWRVLGLQLQLAASTEAPLAGSKYRGGLRVLSVRPGSPAAASGILKGDLLVGLHIWEAISDENVAFVLDHPQLATFNPLKFYVLRGSETLYGHLTLVGVR